MLLLSLLNSSSSVFSWRLWYPWWSSGVSSFVELSLARQSYFLLSQFLEISVTSNLSPKLFNCIFLQLYFLSCIILQLLGAKEKGKIHSKKEAIFVGFLFCLQLLGVKEKRKIRSKKEAIFVGFLFCFVCNFLELRRKEKYVWKRKQYLLVFCFHVSNSLSIGCIYS